MEIELFHYSDFTFRNARHAMMSDPAAFVEIITPNELEESESNSVQTTDGGKCGNLVLYIQNSLEYIVLNIN